MFLIVLLSLISTISTSYCDICNGSVVDTFLAEYDFTVRPSESTEEPTAVVLHLDIRHVSLQEEKAQMIMFADLNMSWNDTRLAWNETEWDCSILMVDLERIWKPQLDAGVTGTDVTARVDPEGLVMVSQRIQQNAPLNMELRDWPKDSHSAEFVFISVASIEEVQLVLSNNKMVTLHESGSWEVGKIHEVVDSWQERSAAIWTVAVLRRQPALVLAARSVIVCSVVLVIATLLLPPAQRASLALAAVLCTSIWLSSCVARLPPTPGSPITVSVVAALSTVAAISALSGCAYNSAPQRFLVGLLAKFKITNGQYGDVVKTLDLIFCGILLLAVLIVLLVYVCA